MQLLALEQECRHLPPEEAAAILRAEARMLWTLQQEGSVREAWFRTDRKEAVLLLEAADATEARAVLARLPLVQQGVIAFELIPLTPYDGYARLFSPA